MFTYMRIVMGFQMLICGRLFYPYWSTILKFMTANVKRVLEYESLNGFVLFRERMNG